MEVLCLTKRYDQVLIKLTVQKTRKNNLLRSRVANINNNPHGVFIVLTTLFLANLKKIVS